MFHQICIRPDIRQSIWPNTLWHICRYSVQSIIFGYVPNIRQVPEYSAIWQNIFNFLWGLYLFLYPSCQTNNLYNLMLHVWANIEHLVNYLWYWVFGWTENIQPYIKYLAKYSIFGQLISIWQSIQIWPNIWFLMCQIFGFGQIPKYLWSQIFSRGKMTT